MRRKTKSILTGKNDLDFLRGWPLGQLEALHRVAKSTPFFRHPKAMMFLRELLEHRRADAEQKITPMQRRAA